MNSGELSRLNVALSEFLNTPLTFPDEYFILLLLLRHHQFLFPPLFGKLQDSYLGGSAIHGQTQNKNKQVDQSTIVTCVAIN